MNAKSEICGVTTTSGLAFKIPGRVGDSPILGAGLYAVCTESGPQTLPAEPLFAGRPMT